MGTGGEDGDPPPREVQVSSFRVDRYPVTNAQFR